MMTLKNTKSQCNKVACNFGLARRSLIILVSIAVVIAVGVFGFLRPKTGGSNNSNPGTGLFTVERGDLTISVTESGDIKAVDSVDIKSKVEGRATIVNIVPEGTNITPEDVNDGKVLVELDSSKLTEQLSQREIELSTAEANFSDANESHLIQVKQNESDVTAAKLKVEFALMDFHKYLGADIAREVVDKMVSDPNINPDLTSLINDPNSLGGEASRRIDTLKDAILLARGSLEKASDVLTGTQKLYDANYASELDLKSAKLDVDRFTVQEKAALKNLELFRLYDFPKEARTFLSDYHEAKLDLERTEARARAQLAQARAKLTSAKATFEMQTKRLEKLHDQIKACIIKAPASGQVVYWSSTEQWVRYKIEQGAEIPEGYKIITIPDASKMKVEVKIHETWIDKIEPNQPAKISIAAFPNEVFTGKVLKKAPLADPDRWMNPDLKVYATDVSIDGTNDSIKTGMSGKVEILIDELDDVLYVPIQSVVTVDEKELCYVKAGGREEKREVETGLFNDDFVEIKSGLNEGEKVLLNPPRWTASETKKEETKEKKKEEEKS
ncbi:MAG: efflux RND transporter periplasmic adaptor subunit [Planctomycetes bacterium]|nr:efflux RND transporter periplasmic adaptor subunit [Planctomycetota bacterium]MBL7142913.1 efflux RND transporter periplasmic adaptor subunit [Phycisphaerae bacterium]